MSAVEGRKLAGPFCEHGYSVLSASISANEKTSLRAERLDAIICQFLKEQNVPGATLAVVKHGCLVYEQGYGVAGAGRRMRADTALRVASISKPITAIAVLRLCQEGTLSLDARVFGSTGILKRLKPRGDKRLKQVTVRHLLQHSAGWDRDMVGDAVFENVPLPEGMEWTSGAYNAHLLQRILCRKLQFTPGSRHAYSNLGYLVLGEVVEAVTGQSYESYLKSILAQIGITGMFVGSEERASWLSSEGEYFNVREPSGAPSVMPGQADSRVVPQYGSFLMRNSGAYGGWVATARDLVKVLCCLEEAVKGSLGEGVSGPDRQDPGAPDAVLSASSVLTMLECPSYESGGRDWYGLGVDVQDGGHTWGHTGAMEGSSATCQRHRSGVTWALVLNAWACNMDLDGVVKSALSAVPHLSPFPSHLAQVCGQVLRVFTTDQGQCVVVHVPLHNLSSLIAKKNLQGFTPVWMSVNTVDGKNFDFNAVFSKDPAMLGRNRVVLTEVSHLPSVLKTCSEDGIHPELITTYTNDDGSPHAVVVLAQREGSCGREVEVCVPVARYLPLLTQRKKNGFRVVSQCVTQCPHTGQLLVTAIMDREGDTLTNTMTNIEEGSFAKETVIHSKDTETDDSGLLKTHAEERVSKQLKAEDSDIKTDQNGPLRTHAQEIISKQLKTEQRGCEESEEGGYSEREHTSTEGSTSAESEGVGSCDSASDRGHKTGDVGYHGGEDSRVCMTGDVLDPAGEGRREGLEEVPSGSKGVNADCAVYLNNEGNARGGLRRSSCSSVEGKRSSVEGKPSFVEGKPSSVEGKPSSVEGKPSSVEGKPSSVEGKPSSVEGKPSSVEGKPSSVEGKPSSVEGKRSSVEGKPSSVEGKPSQHLSPTLLGSSNISLKSDHCVQNECEKSNHSQPGAIRLISSSSSTTKRKRTKSRPVTQLKTLTYVQLEVDSFVAEMARQAKRGCGLQNVHFFPAEDRKWYVSGVWSPSCTHNCYHRMAVSGLGLLPALAEAAAGNVRLKFVCQYEEDGATYYALFWEGPEFGQANKKCRS